MLTEYKLFTAMTSVIKSFIQLNRFPLSFFFSLFTPLFLLVLIEPSCNYILSVISFTSLLVSCQLMEPKIGISQNALHLVIVSNGFSNKCVLLSV